MKKLALTIAIVLGLGLSSFAEGNQGGGLFQRGTANETEYGIGSNRESSGAPMLPAHGQTSNQPAPLGTGIALLLGLGGAYLVAKRRNEE